MDKVKNPPKPVTGGVGHTIPPEVQNLLNGGTGVSTGLDTLGDAYSSAFGGGATGASGADLIAIPVGPQQSSGPGIGGIIVVVLIVVGIWFAYKKLKGG